MSFPTIGDHLYGRHIEDPGPKAAGGVGEKDVLKAGPGGLPVARVQDLDPLTHRALGRPDLPPHAPAQVIRSSHQVTRSSPVAGPCLGQVLSHVLTGLLVSVPHFSPENIKLI